MFEDSTFESTSRIHTRSRRWMVATFAFNASIVLALILIPLIDPEALPRQDIASPIEVPPAPVRQTQQTQPTQIAHHETEMKFGNIIVPSKIPTTIFTPSAPEPATNPNAATWVAITDPSGVDPFDNKKRAIVVHPETTSVVRVSGRFEEGLLIEKRLPVYPPIARVAGIDGTVTLAATISKTGTIENLSVTGGPAMLQRAALEAVKSWRYRPYLLNGQPVEVETTVNVIFTLAR
jgi:protein TonB